MKWWEVLGLGVMLVLIILILTNQGSTSPSPVTMPKDGPAGGVTAGIPDAGTPTESQPNEVEKVETAPAPAPTPTPTPAPTPPAGPPKTYAVRVVKTPKSGVSDEVVLSVGEVRVYVGSILLKAADFSSAVHGIPSGGYEKAFPASRVIDGNIKTFAHSSTSTVEKTLTLTLKVPAVVTKVEVINRQDCCQHRLANSKVQLLSQSGLPQASFNLTTARPWQSFPVMYH